LLCCFDVSALRRFIAAAQQNDDRVASPYKVKAVAGAVVDAQFANAFEKLGVTEKTISQASDALRNTLSSALVS
jgi:predicted nucleic acid-binding protein